jgi:CHAT domain-containing protein
MIQKNLDAVGALALQPLLPYVRGSPRWVISPDGPLWLLPWAALPVAGDYAVEKYVLSLAISGRDLTAPRPRVKATAPAIFADVDYGKPGRTFGPLPKSAEEAEDIEPELQKYAGVKPDLFKRGRAREETFRALHSPRVVVLSTHGFFREGTSANPLLCCGLAFADANKRQGAARPGPAARDGVLFGLEVLDVDLRGTELVVLSACETAVGKVQPGEGVLSLQSAFQMAGAEAVLGTLWEVPDRDTGKITADFFTFLADGADRATALCKAQRLRIAQRKKDDGAAHPVFWAGLGLTGRWN